MVDHASINDAAMATPKSNNSGVATPTSVPTVIGANDSYAEKTSTSGAVSSK